MRRTTAVKYAVAGSALAALSIGGAAAFADHQDPDPSAVVNKNGHQVNENAADGQARAGEARAQRLEKAAEREAEDTDTEDTETEVTETEDTETEDAEAPTEEKTDNGNHGGPAEQAGDHPNPKAFENPRHETPQGPKEGAGPENRQGPNERAGDHPNVNATDGPGSDRPINNGRGGK